MLKKRKTPINALFAEREGIRMYHIIKPQTMNQQSLIPISRITIDEIVMIDKHSYQYKGQKTVRKQGIKKTIYLFKGLSTTVDREFNVTKAPAFKMENKILKMN